jgi:cystathionine beta-lyase/cystathionine gamma-synthase
MAEQPTLGEILNQLGEDRSGWRGAVTPPIFETSNFAFPTVAAMRAAGRSEYDSAFYTRGNNPTVEVLRKKLAALEGTEDALVFGSGAAALAAGVLAGVRAGDHVVAVQKPYSWTRVLLRDWLPRFGIAVSFVDARETAAVAEALRPETRLIVLESPNSLTMELQDLAAIAALARPRGIRTLCDNSYSSPLLQRPADHGIDLVAHSATKYLNGHSDVVAGVLCGPRAILEEVFRGPYMTFGAIPGPFEAWLMLRGLRTLPLRLERSRASAAQVVDYLAAHPKVARVYYPGHTSDPQRELALRQSAGGSGLLSFELKAADIAGIERFCDALKHFLLAVSWGGHESLVWPMAVVLKPDRPPLDLGGVPWKLVRLSIGLEEPELLIADLAQALERV